MSLKAAKFIVPVPSKPRVRTVRACPKQKKKIAGTSYVREKLVIAKYSFLSYLVIPTLKSIQLIPSSTQINLLHIY